MLWLKAFHVVFVIAWFTGIFALPRLFVYHVSLQDSNSKERFKVMERRMFGMMTFGATMTLVFAIAMLIHTPEYLDARWLRAKLVLVALVIGYHVWCYRLMIAFRLDQNSHSERWYRLFNELPLVPLIGIVVLVVVKPF